tara:strand:- start:1134 stop:1754 length:621 start_codon:yes stop_codon:yes gene_type:complete
MDTRPAQIIDTVNKMPGLATGGGAAAAGGGLAGAIPGVNLALLGIDMAATGIKEGKEAKEQGATTGQAVLEGALSSVGLGDLYTPKGIKERQASEKEFAEATSNVNDQLAKNLAAQKSNVTMKEENEDMPPMTMAPLKQLSPYTASYSAYNMSAKQASMEPKMQMLSGAATLMTAAQENAFGPDSELAKEDPARAKKIYEGIDKND